MNRVLDVDGATWSPSRPGSPSASWGRRWRRAGWRSRTRATSTRRRSAEQSPPPRTGPAARFAQHLLAGGRRAAGHGGRRRCRASRGRRPARRPRLARRPGRDLGGHAALRARLHDPPGRRAAPLDDVLARFDEHVGANDHFELFVFPYTRTALTLTSERTRSRAPRPAGAIKRFLRDFVLENAALELACRLGRRLPAAIPRINRTLVSAMSRAEHLDAEPPRLRQPAHGSLHRDGVRDPARAHGRGARASAGSGRAAPTADRLPDRGARGRARRRAAVDRPRPRDRLPRRAPIPRHGVRELLPRGRGDHGRIRAGARTGASATTRRAATLRPRYPGFDRFLAVRERLDPERKFENDYLRRVLG